MDPPDAYHGLRTECFVWGTSNEDEMDNGRIQFQEAEIELAQLLKEIGTPGLKKNFKLPPHIAVELRRQQVSRLEENIAVLRRKQEEFHQKMEDYISSLQGLIDNLQKGLKADAEKTPAESGIVSGGTLVRCVGCGAERAFSDVDVLFAREPGDVFTAPTEVIVQKAGKLRKGTFCCPRCGECNLSIRPCARS